MANKIVDIFVVKSIANLYLQSKSADVHFAFIVDGETVKVPAHKAILAVGSTVFDAMFFGPIKEKAIEIVPTDVRSFEEFLQFFYLPEATIAWENI